MLIKKSNSLKNISLFTLKEIKNVREESKFEFFAKIQIDESKLYSSKSYTITLKANNLNKEASVLSLSDSIMSRLRTKKNKVINTKIKRKTFYAQNTAAIREIKVRFNIKSEDFINSLNSKFYQDKILNIDLILSNEKKELIDIKKNLNFNIKDLALEESEDYTIETVEKQQTEYDYISKLVSSLNILKNNRSSKLISLDYSIKASNKIVKSLENSCLVFSENENLIYNDKLLMNSIDNFTINCLELLDNKSQILNLENNDILFSKQNFFSFFVNLLQKNKEIFLYIYVLDKDKKTLFRGNSWSLNILKENIDLFFMVYFYNCYAISYIQNRFKCKFLEEELCVIYNEDNSKQKFIYFDYFLERYSSFVKVKVFRNRSLGKSVDLEEILVFKNKRIRDEYNISKEFITLNYFFKNSQEDLNFYFNIERSKNKKIKNYLDFSILLENSFIKLEDKVLINIQEKEKQSRTATKTTSGFNSFLTASDFVNSEIEKNIQVYFDNSFGLKDFFNINIDVSSLKSKNIYSFLGYESYNEFIKSILVEMQLEIIYFDEKISQYKDLFFLEEYVKESNDEIVDRLITDAKKENFLLFNPKNKLKKIRRIDDVKILLSTKCVLLNKDNYNNLLKDASDQVKSNLYKDSYSVNSSKNLNHVEKLINYIHSEYSDVNIIKQHLIDLLYATKFDYKKTYTLTIK